MRDGRNKRVCNIIETMTAKQDFCSCQKRARLDGYCRSHVQLSEEGNEVIRH